MMKQDELWDQLSATQDRVTALEAELSQARVIETRVRARMEASERRARLEEMVAAVISGSNACGAYLMGELGAGAVVDGAERLLAEVDRRCSASDEPCRRCNGTGEGPDSFHAPKDCQECHGTGRLPLGSQR